MSGPFKMKGMDFGNSPMEKKIWPPGKGPGSKNWESQIEERMKKPDWNAGTKYSDLSDEDKERISNPEYQKLLKEKVEAEIKANE